MADFTIEGPAVRAEVVAKGAPVANPSSNTELCVRLKAPVKFANNEIFPGGAAVTVSGRARECLKLVRQGKAVPMLAVPNLPSGVDGSLQELTPGLIPGEPRTFDAFRKRYKEILLKQAHELSLTSTEPLPQGKSWFDLAAERRWAKLQARSAAEIAAEEAAHAELLNHFQAEAKRQEDEAEAALARAKSFREQATRATELVTFEAAAHELKTARDSVRIFEELGDERAKDARKRLKSAEAKFAEAERVKKTYEARSKLLAAQNKINGSVGPAFPKERIKEAQRCASQAHAGIEAGDFAGVAEALAELESWLVLPSLLSAGPGVGGLGIVG